MFGRGKPPIGVMRADVINNPDGGAFIRIRQVARDFREKGQKREDLSDATPALDTLKSMLALSFRAQRSGEARKWKPLLRGLRRAKDAMEALAVEEAPLRNEAGGKGVGGGLRG